MHRETLGFAMSNERRECGRLRRVAAAASAGALALGALALSAGPRPASAAFPGSNGLIVFDRFFVSHGKTHDDVATIRPDGSSLRQLTRGGYNGSASFSPDGKKIVFSTATSRSIVVMNADGSQARRLTYRKCCGEYSPVFSPDGKRIVFERQPRGGKAAVFAMNADGSGLRRIHVVRGREAPPDKNLSFSPDGRTIAFTDFAILRSNASKREIYLMNSDGSNVRRLTHTPGKGESLEPDFSPDGTQIVFTRIHQDCSGGCRLPAPDIDVMNADGSNVRQLTSENTGDTPAASPAFSPDGRQIAFLHEQGIETLQRPLELYLMDADGSHVKRLTHSHSRRENRYPSWQPLP